jgi:hypothetical protein
MRLKATSSFLISLLLSVLLLNAFAFVPVVYAEVPTLQAEGVQTYTNAYQGKVCVFLRKNVDKTVSQSAVGNEQPQLKSARMNVE